MLKTEPSSVPAHYLQGLNYYHLKMFTEAVDGTAEDGSAQSRLRACLFQSRHGTGPRRTDRCRHRTRCNGALQLDATNFEAAFNLGVAFLQKKQLEPAAAAFRQSVTIYPDFARGHRALGETLLYQDKLDDAISENCGAP